MLTWIMFDAVIQISHINQMSSIFYINIIRFQLYICFSFNETMIFKVQNISID